MKTTASFSLVFLCVLSSYGQNNVGINTNTPNRHAVLELASPESNQGLLVPRLTTSQRLLMKQDLTIDENGLMVYDDESGFFYYWKNTDWIPGLGALVITEAGGDLDGFYPNPSIAMDAVTTDKIEDLAVTTSKLDDAAVTTEKLRADAITTSKVADGAITGSKLEDVGLEEGIFGNQFSVLQLTVDKKGRVIGVIEVPILITSENIEDLTLLGEDIANGTIAISKLDPEGNTDKVLAIDEGGRIYWEERANFTSSELSQDHIFIGNDRNAAERQPVGGDVTLTNTGAEADFQLNPDVVTTEEILDATISRQDIGDNAVSSEKVEDGE